MESRSPKQGNVLDCSGSTMGTDSGRVKGQSVEIGQHEFPLVTVTLVTCLSMTTGCAETEKAKMRG